MANPWFGLSLQAARLAWEAQTVMALRMMRMAAGGAQGRSETSRLVTEKVAALVEAQAAATVGAVQGKSGPVVARKVLNVYKKRVRGNRRRLSK
jgi:hypothetical protein